jgi:hypothetical protein
MRRVASDAKWTFTLLPPAKFGVLGNYERPADV